MADDALMDFWPAFLADAKSTLVPVFDADGIRHWVPPDVAATWDPDAVRRPPARPAAFVDWGRA